MASLASSKKPVWKLLRVSYRGMNDSKNEFTADDGVLSLELAMTSSPSITIIKDFQPLLSFLIHSNQMQTIYYGDSMAFLFEQTGALSCIGHKQIRVRFATDLDALACKAVFESVGIFFQAENCNETFSSGSGGVTSFNTPQVSSTSAQIPCQSFDREQLVLQETVRLLLQDPTFPDFVAKVESALKNLIP